MKKIRLSKFIACTLIYLASSAIPTHAAQGVASAYIGKDGWLFYRFDYSDASDLQTTDDTLDLIKRFNKLASDNDITMLLVLPPLKMKVYSEFLPDLVKINPTMMEQADSAQSHKLPQFDWGY